MTTYTASINPPAELDHKSLLKMKVSDFDRIYFHNSLVAGYLTINNDGEFQHIFKPVICNTVEQDGSIATDGSQTIIFNGVDTLGMFMPMYAHTTVLGFNAAVVKRSEWPNHFPDSKVLTKTLLKDTAFANEEDWILVCYPSHLPLPFKKKIPYGSCDDSAQHVVTNTISSTAARWLALARSTYHNMDDVTTILGRILEKDYDKYLGPDSMTRYDLRNILPPASYRVLTNLDAYEASEDIKKVFITKTVQMPTVTTKSHQAPATVEFPKGIYLKNADDDDKADNRKLQTTQHKLFFLGGRDIDWTAPPDQAIPSFTEEPLFTNEFAEILDTKSDKARVTKLQNMYSTAGTKFGNKVTPFATATSAIDSKADMRFLSRTAAKNILEANYSTERVRSLNSENASVDLLVWAAQSGSASNINMLRDTERKQQSEASSDIPDSQRTQVDVNIKRSGRLTNLDEAIILASNFVKGNELCVQPAFKKGDYESVVVSAFKILLALCERNDVRQWAESFKEKQPQYHIYLFNAFESVFLAAARAITNSYNIAHFEAKNYELIDPSPYETIVAVVQETKKEVEGWMRREVPCDVFPLATPPDLNLPLLQIKRLEELAKAAATPVRPNNRGRGKGTKDPKETSSNNEDKSTEDTENPNPPNKKQRRNTQRPTREKQDPSKLGVFVAIPGKDPPRAAVLYANLGLSKQYCLDWNTVGKECTNSNCPRSHDTFIKMPKEDRDKILNNLLTTKAAYLNPALAKNPRFVGLLGEEHRVLFPPGTTIAGADTGASAA
jgi:hypothetical protein